MGIRFRYIWQFHQTDAVAQHYKRWQQRRRDDVREMFQRMTVASISRHFIILSAYDLISDIDSMQLKIKSAIDSRPIRAYQRFLSAPTKRTLS